VLRGFGGSEIKSAVRCCDDEIAEVACEERETVRLNGEMVNKANAELRWCFVEVRESCCHANDSRSGVGQREKWKVRGMNV